MTPMHQDDYGQELSQEDRTRTIDLLTQLLRPRFLREYLTEEVERLVAACEATQPWARLKVPDADLPGLLLDLHGAEILRDRQVRQEAVQSLEFAVLRELLEAGDYQPARGRADAVAQIVNRKWTPGKRWARQFCAILGFPPSLAGSPDGAQAPAVEDLVPYVPLPPLHDFQEDLRDRLLELMREAGKGPRCILTLPTGAGKTRTCVEALVQSIREGKLAEGHVLWLAQSEELCEQAVQAFREVWTAQTVSAAAHGKPDPPDLALPLYRVWASRPLPEGVERAIIVGSIQKLDRASDHEPELFESMLAKVRVVVVDEAHHAIAPSYTRLFKSLEFRRKGGNRAMVGLTATPYRGSQEETARLIRRFDGKLLAPPWDNAIGELRSRGVLAYAETRKVETHRKFTMTGRELEWFERFSDIPEQTLRKIGNDIERNQQILDCLLDIPESQPVLFFACSVSHARAIALLLRRQGRAAAAVTAETPRSLRRTWIQQFKQGLVQFLCNYGILTTGFDAPRVEVVVIGRPTSSVLLYEQMVGRGMRGPLNGGTPSCRVVDMVDIFPQFGEQMSYERYRSMWREFPTGG